MPLLSHSSFFTIGLHWSVYVRNRFSSIIITLVQSDSKEQGLLLLLLTTTTTQQQQRITLGSRFERVEQDVLLAMTCRWPLPHVSEHRQLHEIGQLLRDIGTILEPTKDRENTKQKQKQKQKTMPEENSMLVAGLEQTSHWMLNADFVFKMQV